MCDARKQKTISNNYCTNVRKVKEKWPPVSGPCGALHVRRHFYFLPPPPPLDETHHHTDFEADLWSETRDLSLVQMAVG